MNYDTIDDNSQTEKKAAPILNRKNYREWFKLIEIHLKNKRAGNILIKNRPTPSVTTVRLGSYQLSPEKQWERNNTKIEYQLWVCIDSIDYKIIERLTTAKLQQKALKKKYTTIIKKEHRRLRTEFATFVLKDETIPTVQAHLQYLYKKMCSVSGLEFDYKELFRQLLAGLPEEYMILVETIDVRIDGVISKEIQYEHWITKLDDKQRSLYISNTAAATRDYGKSYSRSSQKRNKHSISGAYNRRRRFSSSGKSLLRYYLYKTRDYRSNRCPLVKKFRSYVKDYTERQKDSKLYKDRKNRKFYKDKKHAHNTDVLNDNTASNESSERNDSEKID